MWPPSFQVENDMSSNPFNVLEVHHKSGESIAFPSNDTRSVYYTVGQLSGMSGYHPVHLRRLLLDGRIKGIKVQLGDGPGFWVSTLEAIQEYQANKDSRGRPQKSLDAAK